MTDGIIFDIREFALHDGPGIRTTVVLKGCPLVCVWCHNPEGKAPAPQVMHTPGGDRIVGKTYTPQALATYLNHQAAILAMNEGGVTFSGGEPLMQAQFIHETLDLLTPIPCLLDTSGYANPSLFRQIVTRFHLVYFDLKLIDEQAHLAYTGVSNAPILANLHTLAQCGVPYVIRVPLIPSITDTEANLNAIAETVKGLPGLERVDLLPYNTLAGAKYPQLGLTYMLPDITTQTIQHRAEIFSGKGIPVLCQ